jgi:hypothetical protein
MSLQTADVLNLLDDVIKNGEGWICRCPAHFDLGKPNLTVSDSGGKALFHCFKGCSHDDVANQIKRRIDEYEGQQRESYERQREEDERREWEAYEQREREEYEELTRLKDKERKREENKERERDEYWIGRSKITKADWEYLFPFPWPFTGDGE